MRMTAADLLELGVADEVIPEPEGRAHSDPPGRCLRRWTTACPPPWPQVVKEGSLPPAGRRNFAEWGRRPWKENP